MTGLPKLVIRRVVPSGREERLGCVKTSSGAYVRSAIAVSSAFLDSRSLLASHKR